MMKRKILLSCGAIVALTLSMILLLNSRKVEIIDGTLLANMEAMAGCMGGDAHDHAYCGGSGSGVEGLVQKDCYSGSSATIHCICKNLPYHGERPYSHSSQCLSHWGGWTYGFMCENCSDWGYAVSSQRYVCAGKP